MREDAAEQYKLIDSKQDWKSKWFYITNHHPELPKPSGKLRPMCGSRTGGWSLPCVMSD
jgi:hypothetical protein